jgi:membrane-bound metal-dependent hydrolase YbcI (DUF457 family)
VGSCAARSFGLITEALAVVVRKISGGHREGSHTGCGDVLCALLATLAIALEGDRFRVHYGAVSRELSTGRVILAVEGAILLGAGMKALRILHRGNVRREAVAITVAVVIAWTGLDAGGIAWAILLGTAVHCAGDALTKHGVAWLQPFSKHVFHLLPERFRLSTGHGAEHVIAFAMLLALVALGWHEVSLSVSARTLIAGG